MTLIELINADKNRRKSASRFSSPVAHQSAWRTSGKGSAPDGNRAIFFTPSQKITGDEKVPSTFYPNQYVCQVPASEVGEVPGTFSGQVKYTPVAIPN
jgi:hypothetical protein